MKRAEREQRRPIKKIIVDLFKCETKGKKSYINTLSTFQYLSCVQTSRYSIQENWLCRVNKQSEVIITALTLASHEEA